jgi:hypothetical protein
MRENQNFAAVSAEFGAGFPLGGSGGIRLALLERQPLPQAVTPPTSFSTPHALPRSFRFALLPPFGPRAERVALARRRGSIHAHFLRHLALCLRRGRCGLPHRRAFVGSGSHARAFRLGANRRRLGTSDAVDDHARRAAGGASSRGRCGPSVRVTLRARGGGRIGRPSVAATNARLRRAGQNAGNLFA